MMSSSLSYIHLFIVIQTSIIVTQQSSHEPPSWNPTCNGSVPTFRTIQDECENVATASKLGLCSSKSDLVWDDHCGCPYCACSVDSNQFRQFFDFGFSKECVNASCGAPPEESNITQSVYQFESVLVVDKEYNWNDFQCPPTYCTDSGNVYSPGEGWRVDDGSCDSYCYCNGDGTHTCAKGFDVIVTSSNQGLASSFYAAVDSFDDNLVDCLNEPHRIFAAVSANQSTCDRPRCDCGSHQPGDSWYTEYNGDANSLKLDPNSHTTLCSYCQCVTDESGNYSYAHCNDGDMSYEDSSLGVWYVSGSGSCPPPVRRSCNSGDSESAQSRISVLNPETCEANAPSTFCYMESEAFAQCDDGRCWSYGCTSSGDTRRLLCAAYANDGCIYRERTSTVGQETLYDDEYLYCCSDDYCNQANIDISRSSCAKSEGYAEYYRTYDECAAKAQNDTKIQNEIDAYYQANNASHLVMCELVKDFMYSVGGGISCKCKLLSLLYEPIAVNNPEWIEEIENLFTRWSWSAWMERWIETLGCSDDISVDFQCDFANGIVVYGDDGDDVDIYYSTTRQSAVTVIDTTESYENTDDSHNDSNRGASPLLIGGVVGGIAVALFIVGCVAFMYLRKDGNKEKFEAPKHHNDEIKPQLASAISLARNEGADVNNDTAAYV